MKYVWNLIVYIVLPAMLVSACGAPPAQTVPEQPAGTYAIGDTIWPGVTVTGVGPEGWYVTSESQGPDLVFANPDSQQFALKAGSPETDLDRIMRGWKVILEQNGMDSKLVYESTLAGDRVIVYPRLGDPINDLYAKGWISKAEYIDAVWQGRDLFLDAYNRGMLLEEVHTGKIIKNLTTGKVSLYNPDPTFAASGEWNTATVPFDWYLESVDDWLWVDIESRVGIPTDSSTVPVYPYQAVSFPRVAIWEQIPDVPEVGKSFRGLEITAVDGEWGQISGQVDIDDYIWYRKANGVVEFRREMNNLTSFADADYYVDLVRRGADLTATQAYVSQEGARIFIYTPDLGVPLESWLMQNHTNATLKSLATQIEDLLVDMCFGRKQICWSTLNELGTRQIVIDPKTLKMTVVDFEYVVAPGTGELVANESAYRAFIRNQLRQDFANIGLNLSVIDDDSVLPLATMGAPVAPMDSVPVGSVQGTIPVQFMSAIDGEIIIKYATQDQINRMKLGGEDLLVVTRELGVPMPKAKFGFWSKAGIVFSEVLFVADIVGTEYIIGINSIDILGFGETKQLSGWIDTSSEPLYSTPVIPQDILASETLKAQAEALAAEGYEKSPAFYVYYDHRHITDVLASVIRDIQPYRLDNHGSKSLGVFDDYDSVLPIAASSPDAYTVEYVNVTTGDKIVWRLQEGGWTIVQGDSCMTFNAVVFNNRNEGIIMPFRFCTSTSGNVIFPVWWE